MVHELVETEMLRKNSGNRSNESGGRRTRSLCKIVAQAFQRDFQEGLAGRRALSLDFNLPDVGGYL